MFPEAKAAPATPATPAANGPLRVMLSRQTEMHRILLEEHQKLQKSHHQLCEKLMAETRQLVSSGRDSRRNSNTCSRLPVASSTSSMTRIPRSVSLKKLSSKSVMDLRFLPHGNSHHHRSHVNLLQHDGHESDDHDGDGTSNESQVDDHVNELKQQVGFVLKAYLPLHLYLRACDGDAHHYVIFTEFRSTDRLFLSASNHSLGLWFPVVDRQLKRVTDQLRDSKDQNELLEFRIFELEKVNEELMEQASPFSSSSADPRLMDDVSHSHSYSCVYV